MFKLTYKKSSGNLNLPVFSADKLSVPAINASSEYLIPQNVPVFDQGDIGSCAANSITGCLQLIKSIQNPNQATSLSRLFLYWNGRVYDNDTSKDDGMFIHNALNSVKTLGICSEELFPYDTTKVFEQPTILSFKEASDNQIVEYYQITSSGDQKVKDIEAAIRSNHPVVFGTLVSEEFQSYFNEPEKVFDPPKDGGGHAMIIIGVRLNSAGKREFQIRNSWSESWGENGYCWFSEEYVKWDETADLFVPTLIPDLIRE